MHFPRFVRRKEDATRKVPLKITDPEIAWKRFQRDRIRDDLRKCHPREEPLARITSTRSDKVGPSVTPRAETSHRILSTVSLFYGPATVRRKSVLLSGPSALYGPLRNFV